MQTSNNEKEGQMRLPIKIVFDFDSDNYRVFVDGLSGITGSGNTEAEAIEDFKLNYERMMEN